MGVLIPVLLLLLLMTDDLSARRKGRTEALEPWVSETIPSINWCSKDLSCGKGKNIMCRRNDPEVLELRKNCYNLKSMNTPEFRRKMLSLHNSFRNMVASGKSPLPGATNMRQLSWNVITEVTAKVWISYCRVGVAHCRKTPHSPQGTGQNYFLLGTDTVNTDGREPPTDSLPCFVAWSAALPFLPPRYLQKYHFNKSLMDSFAQLILAEVTLLGCSEATYGQSGFQFRVLVCNYDLPVVGGQEIYKTGKPCSGCPKGTACNNQSIYPYLCALPDDSDIEGPPIAADELLDAILARGSLFDARQSWLFTQFQFLWYLLNNAYW